MIEPDLAGGLSPDHGIFKRHALRVEFLELGIGGILIGEDEELRPTTSHAACCRQSSGSRENSAL
jgi:hypothetical protein